MGDFAEAAPWSSALTSICGKTPQVRARRRPMSAIQMPKAGPAIGPSDPASVGEQARKLLLATMPVTERRLWLAGVATSGLTGGAGRPMPLPHGPGAPQAKWTPGIPEMPQPPRCVDHELEPH